jgi:uncharacterized protein
MRNPYDAIGRIGLLLAIVGAVNWLLVGVFEWNLVKWVFTQSGTQTVGSLGERIVYIVIGAGGVLAIPMLAATLSRARGSGVRADEDRRRDRSHASDTDADDTAFYYGAPKEARAEDRRDVAAASVEGATGEGRGTQPSGPVRKTERVIIRTEEPVTGSSESRTSSTQRDLSYGQVEEADDEYGEGTEERRAA